MDPPSQFQGFSSEINNKLQQPLNESYVKTREQAGRKLSYIEGWHAIDEANKIFGFGCWTREIIRLECVAQTERLVGRAQKPGWGVTYIASVRVNVNGVIREGSGAGHGIDTDLGQAHESALKEAETDAMKRALMTFGNPFGLALYDKEMKEVVKDSPPAGASGATLEERAIEVCRQAGLSEEGIASFADRLTQGTSELMKDVAAEKLQQLIEIGPSAISAKTIAECNGSTVWISSS